MTVWSQTRPVLRSTAREYRRSALRSVLARMTKKLPVSMKATEPIEVDVSAIHDVDGHGARAPTDRSHPASCSLPSLMKMKDGILPRKSKSVKNLTAALVERNGAQGKTERHRLIVVASSA